MVSSPDVVALAGPNGAGKSTTGLPLLKETLGVTQFVNADLIAEGLAAFDPDGAALTAGKVMLSRIKGLASSRTTFAFETTLAGRSYARLLSELIQQGLSVSHRLSMASQPGVYTGASQRSRSRRWPRGA
jgi:predicted ABC-type ATPase